MRQRMIKAGVLLEALLIVLGLGFLGKACMVGAFNYKFVHMAEAADGQVNGVFNYGLSLNVQFTQAEGKIFIFQQNGILFNYASGDAVPVLYDPTDPEVAMVDAVGALWFTPILFFIPGFVLLYFGIKLRGERNL